MDYVITDLDKVLMEYDIPVHLMDFGHLMEIENNEMDEMRARDLLQLGEQLKRRGSSLQDKIVSKQIWRTSFPGMVLDAMSIYFDPKSREVEIEAFPIHPHRADLAYKNDSTLERNVCPITVNGVLTTRDNRIVVGVRRGEVDGGKVGIVPGGHAEYRPKKIDLMEHLAEEFKEELGYELPTDKTKLMALFSNKDTKGVNVLYAINTDLDFFDVADKWAGAKDRDEHSSLLGIDFYQAMQLAKPGYFNDSGKKYETTPFFQDCFAHYLNA